MNGPNDSAHFYDALLDLLERRVAILYAKTGKDWRRFIGRVYDPQRGGAGDGRTCRNCRRISPSDARVCRSCGQMIRMAP
jgi:hypothetical protein